MAGTPPTFTRAAAVIIAAASLFYAPAAQASCSAPVNTGPMEIRVTESWKAEHVSDGDIPGCLLNAETTDGRKITAYTHYDFICALKPDEKITVAPSYACCDTGLQGDFTCGVKPRVPLNVVGQTLLSIAPAAHNARAIVDLMRGSLSGSLREASSIVKLQEYLGDPAYSETVKKELPQLEATIDNGTMKDPYTRGLVAALLLAGEPDSPKRDDWRIMQFEGGIDYALTPVQKSIAQELLGDPVTADRFMPVLITRLRNAGDDDRAFLLATAGRAAASKKHVNAIYDALGPLIIDPAAPDTRPPPADENDRLRRDEEKKQMARMTAETTLRAQVLLPFVKKIACQNETGKVTVGQVYKTEITCD